MIQLINLTKHYGKLAAVDGLNIEVPAGQIFGFLGPNGAGKTSTMRMIATVVPLFVAPSTVSLAQVQT